MKHLLIVLFLSLLTPLTLANTNEFGEWEGHTLYDISNNIKVESLYVTDDMLSRSIIIWCSFITQELGVWINAGDTLNKSNIIFKFDDQAPFKLNDGLTSKSSDVADHGVSFNRDISSAFVSTLKKHKVLYMTVTNVGETKKNVMFVVSLRDVTKGLAKLKSCI